MFLCSLSFELIYFLIYVLFQYFIFISLFFVLTVLGLLVISAAQRASALICRV